MNVYLPSEAIIRDRRRFLDWRFLSALAALILVTFLVYAGFRNYAIREQEAAQKDALISELSERADQINALERDIARLSDRAAQDRRESSRERDKLLRQQERMIRLLRSYGIDPPAGTTASSGSTSTRPASTSLAPAATPGRSAGRPGRAHRGSPASPSSDPTPPPHSEPTPPPADEEPTLLGLVPLPDLPSLL